MHLAATPARSQQPTAVLAASALEIKLPLLMLLIATQAAAIETQTVTVAVDPSQCNSQGECSALLNGAIKKCAAAQVKSCSVELQPGEYNVKCPDAARSSTTKVEAPAVCLLQKLCCAE